MFGVGIGLLTLLLFYILTGVQDMLAKPAGCRGLFVTKTILFGLWPDIDTN